VFRSAQQGTLAAFITTGNSKGKKKKWFNIIFNFKGEMSDGTSSFLGIRDVVKESQPFSMILNS
jgi:hypothetical protein